MIKKILTTLFFTLLFGNLTFAAGGDGGSTKSNLVNNGFELKPLNKMKKFL